MLKLNQMVKVKWHSQSKKHYIDKGYVFTNYNDSFLVRAEDLSKSLTIKVKIICDFCGNEYEMSWYHYNGILNKNEKCACYNCRHSHGLIFEQEKWFNDCRDVNPLPFDFYLPNNNIVIEFDGEQHFKERHFTHSKLSYTQLHDAIKNKYCKNNNIYLIRIPYWDINNIEEILDNKLLTSHKDIV